MDGLQVHRLSSNDDKASKAWDAFVIDCAQATFFHTSTWQRVFEMVLSHATHYLYVCRGSRIVGVLPLVEVKTLLFGHSLTSLPYLAYGGAAVNEGDEDAAQALEQAADALARSLGVTHLELRQRTRVHAQWPRLNDYVTFRQPILDTDEANLQAIPRKQRAMVRKGMSNGLRACFDTTVDRFFDVYATGMHRHGTPALPKRYFEAIQSMFGEACNVLVIESQDGRPLSAVLSFYFRDEVIPYYAGDDEGARPLAANDFKYWELMRHAKAQGCKTFDYGRSKVGSGSYAFKKHWGFEPVPLNYEFCLYKRKTVPQNNPANQRYKLLIQAWRRMPRALVDRLGPVVVRGLG